MQPNHLVHKILFPIDFSNLSLETLSYVVQVAKIFEAELILLHTFRLTEGISHDEKIGEKKRNLELDAYDQYKIIDERYLKRSGVRCFFQSEVGFTLDRIMANIKEHTINLLIISREMLEKESREKNNSLIINQVGCPIMLLG